ncbi:hypothetical protein BGZ94_005808, partial [Podila epigama]
MAFLQAHAGIPAVVLTSYQKEMSSLTSSDLDDTWDPVGTVNNIEQAASAISKSVWLQAQGISDASQMTAEQQQSIGSIQVDKGSGLLFKEYDFPIYALNTIDERNTMSYTAVLRASQVNQIKGYNNYPLKAVQFHSFMWAARDSGSCLRKGWCTPVGGASVWSTPSSNISATDEKPIIVVAAAMDARSLFHDLTLGVDSSVTGMVTLMAVAEALSRSTIPLDTMPKHIVYTLFTGEAWGFSGSQRFVQDISKTVECIKPAPSGAGCSFPFYSNMDFQRIKFANIESIFEASQVG